VKTANKYVMEQCRGGEGDVEMKVARNCSKVADTKGGGKRPNREKPRAEQREQNSADQHPHLINKERGKK